MPATAEIRAGSHNSGTPAAVERASVPDTSSAQGERMDFGETRRTERDDAERRLTAQDGGDERFRLMIEGSEQAFFFEHDADHVLTYVSPSIRNVLGYEPVEVVGRRYDELMTGDSSNEAVAGFTDSALREGARGPCYTAIAVHKSGHHVWIEINEAPATNQRGEAVMQGFCRDVTARHLAEEKLRVSDEIVRAVDSIVLVADAQGKIKYANPFAAKLVGVPAEKLLGDGWWKLTATDSAEEHSARIGRQARGEMPVATEPYEEMIRDSAGNPHWILWSDSNGPGNVLIGTGQEITTRRLAECELAERTARLDALIENVRMGILAVDASHRVIMCNPEFERLFQYSSAEIEGHAIVPLIVPEPLRDEALRTFGQVMAGRAAQLNVRRMRKDGVELLVELQAVPLRVNGQITGCYFIYRDVTERVRAEQALRDSEERLELFFSQSLVGAFFMMLDEPVQWNDSVDKERVIDYVRSNQRVTKVNHALATQYRTTPDKLLGMTPEMTYARCPAHNREFTRRLLDSDHVEALVEDRAMDGTPLWVETDYIRMCDSVGRIVGHFGMRRDVTERKSLEQQLRQSQKMEAVGRLAGGVAHDFNNMLTVIRGYSELMMRKLPEKDPLARYAKAIVSAADRSATITQQLLAFSRQQVLQLQVLSLNTVVSDMGSLLRRLIGEDVELQVLLSAELGEVKADPGQMGQILLNLAVNARDAMPNGGRLIIETSNVQLDEAYANMHLSIRPGPYVMLSVTDTGCGIDPEVRPHIFEPFFTTKEKGKGTGLGLATVYGIVKQSGGSIYVYSEKDEGTTFKIYLPRVDAARPADTPADAGGSVEGKTILLLEDEEDARSMLSESLMEAGYRVLAAASGQQALDLCEREKARVDVVLSDVMLVGMNGQDLAGYLATRFSGVKILYMSGFSRNNLLSRHIIPADAPFLQKPFRMADLFEQLNGLLESEGEFVAQGIPEH